MAGLMYKNFLLYWVELIVIAVFQMFVSATVLLTGIADMGSLEGTLLLYGAMFLLTGFFESGLFASDETRSARSFLISTPTGAAGHIQSKYYFILLINLAVLICCFLTDTAVLALTGDENTVAGVMLVLLFSLSLANEALSLPFIVYFGANYGVGIKMSALGMIILLVLLYALFGDISYFLSNDFMTAMEKLFADDNILILFSLIPYGAVLLYWLSAKLSVVLFRKAVENND